MLTAEVESELRAIRELARGCEKAQGDTRTATLFGALAWRIDNIIEQHGEAAWRRRVDGRRVGGAGPVTEF